MKLTVITVCYQAEAVIRPTIESVLSQDGIDMEYRIIDGASKGIWSCNFNDFTM